MSWHFSRALAAAYSAASCSDGEQSAPSRLTNMPEKSSCLDRMMDASNHSQSGTTSQPSTENPGVVWWMSYLAASRAKTSVPPEKERESVDREAVCGNTWRELWMKYDRQACSWKTHRCLWNEDLPWFSVTLPRWGVLGTKHAAGHCNGERIWLAATSPKSRWREMVCREQNGSGATSNGRSATDAYPCGRIDRIRALESLAGQPAILGSNDGMANRLDRLHCLGNGQHPAVVELAWKTLTRPLGC